MHKRITAAITGVVMSVLLGSAALATDMYSPPLHANSASTSYRCRFCNNSLATNPSSQTLSICSAGGSCVTPAPTFEYFCTVATVSSVGRPQAYCRATFAGAAKKFQALAFSLLNTSTGESVVVEGY